MKGKKQDDLTTLKIINVGRKEGRGKERKNERNKERKKVKKVKD